ncbi:MAG TPA: IclR family transcriptional regulator C-terminal domain-containing protein [Trinickia sp.]|uniref:IclR family transcriptional regulator domain-containing protein n=1 Tax=Trinickia sp. TaxID=2571163 RepID=UPI002C8173DB|nr:IclR family transcriptional regulator C-terminal domain-containing protein [Trinickia sp.]HVW48866.1 IclR family transcriptional regulator C-terminal domain-containing protein [Trinickia sp.]
MKRPSRRPDRETSEENTEQVERVDSGETSDAAPAGDPNFMTSLERGLAVLQAFSQERRVLTTSQISQRTGIPRAAVRRCLYTLAKLGFVTEEDNRLFSLRPRVLKLGHAYLATTPLAHAAQPVLRHISGTLNESSSVAILDGDEILYIARASTSRIMSIDLHIGSRLPAYCTSMGRVLLAQLSPDALDAYLDRTKRIQYTPRTIVSRDGLIDTLESVRCNGYALVDQELEIGLRSIAVPVKGADGRATAALNVGVQAARISVAEMESRILPALLEGAQELALLSL